MLDDSTAYFPMNTVDIYAEHMKAIDPDLAVYKRMVDPTDQTYTICVSPTQWAPEQRSGEIRGGPNEETIQVYGVSIVSIIVDADEERGIRTHSNLATRIRTKLYRDESLRLALGQLKVELDGVVERSLNWTISSQQYLSSESDGYFRFVSALDIEFRTHI